MAVGDQPPGEVKADEAGGAGHEKRMRGPSSKPLSGVTFLFHVRQLGLV